MRENKGGMIMTKTDNEGKDGTFYDRRGYDKKRRE